MNKTAIKQYQQATRDRAKVKTEGGKIIRVEAHPIPEHPRPRRCKGRIALVGDAAGYVTKCSGEVSRGATLLGHLSQHTPFLADWQAWCCGGVVNTCIVWRSSCGATVASV